MKPVPRGFFHVVSALGLLVGLWGWRNQGGLSLPSAELDLRALRYPVEVHGVRIGSPAQLRFWVQSVPPGTRIGILSSPSGVGGWRHVSLVRQLTRPQHAVALVTGLFFLGVNLLIFCPRARSGAERDFYWATLLYGVAILIGGAYRPPHALWPEAGLAVVWIACLTALPFLFAHLTLTFPRRRRWLDRAPALFPALSAVAAALIAGQVWSFLAHLRRPDPETWRQYALALQVAQGALVLFVAAGVIALFQGGSRLELARERRQVRWLQWGFAVGISPYVFFRTLPRLAGIESPIDPSVDRIFELAIPFAFASAVARERFLDIDLVIRRSLIYSILAGVLVAAYFALAYLLGLALRPALPGGSAAISAVAAAIAVVLFFPTRALLGRWVDRALFKIRSDHKRELAGFEARIGAATGQAELAEELRAVLARALAPKQLVVLIPAPAGRVEVGTTGAPGEQLMEELASVSAAGDRPLLAAPQSTGSPERESTEFPEGLRRLGYRLAAPIAFGDAPLGGTAEIVPAGGASAEGASAEGASVEGGSAGSGTTAGGSGAGGRRSSRSPAGWALLGEKSSERRYIDEDLDLLAGALSAAAAALQRIELVQQVAEESIARRRLDEVNRLKNDFLSRVSHDLRTPLTSIGWSVRNLLDGVAGPLEERQREYLAGIRASADQLSRLVTNLVELSRLEADAIRLDLEPVLLADALREAELALRPIAAARRVSISLRTDPALGPVRGDRGKLVQIAVNLLENAVRFSPGDGTVEASAYRLRAGVQGLAVRDSGPGVAPDEREAIFGRYRQGRRSPYDSSPGLGIGLYVVRSLLRLHGGEIEVGDHPAGGAVFTCTFPE